MSTSTNDTHSVEDKKSGHQLVTEIIDNGQVSFQQVLVVVLCLVFNMLDGFDITAMALWPHRSARNCNSRLISLVGFFSFALAGMMVGAMGIATFVRYYRQTQNHNYEFSARWCIHIIYSKCEFPYRIHRPAIH